MEPREIIRYTPEDIVKQSECPACGIDMSSLKKPFSHAKKCFSIRRPGPVVYRIFGYEECQCGLLIHDGSKAQKLHICMGKIPPYDPRVGRQASPSPNQVPLPAPEPAPAALPPPAPDKILQPQKKVWVRNFTSPIKQKFEDIKLSGICKPKPKSVPRVRNFDTPPSRAASDEVCVYSIIRKDESIAIAGGLVIKEKQETKENIIIKKRSLRLPSLRKS